jgi:dipeptidyl aminopeptidase/acylaminoacyl peptidase
MYWVAPQAQPPGHAPRPAIVLVHGHQMGERPGARLYVDSPLFTELPAAGYVVAAVSQPGYGRSDGPPDFCGPVSQEAVRTAVEAVRALPEVRHAGVVLYGHSRGAVTASMVALLDPDLAGVVLGGGVYDMATAYEELPEDSGIRANIDAETGGTAPAFVQRSALLAEGVSTVPTLILHGEVDQVAPVAGARRLAERLRGAGTPVELVIFPELGHRLPWEEKKPAVLRFLARLLGGADEGS